MNAEISRMNRTLTVERLRQVLDYDPVTGIFTWRLRVAQRAIPGSIAGRNSKSRRYSQISIDGVRYPAHRLAWLHFFGVWPSEYVDHIDGNGMNNSISNLREANKSQNGANMRPRSERSLPKGVDLWGGRYRARITKERRCICLGLFPTVDAANDAYQRAAIELFGQYANKADFGEAST